MADEKTEHESPYLAALAGLLYDVGTFARRAGWHQGNRTEAGREFVTQYVPPQWQPYLHTAFSDPGNGSPQHVGSTVAWADRLAAGERAAPGPAQPEQLLSVFCRLEAEDRRAPAARYWPLRALALDKKSLFSGEAWSREQQIQAYRSMWAGFEQEARQLRQVHTGQEESLPTYLESLFLLMQRYTWCVPSAYCQSSPDVSLYDHCRMTAALTTCLSALNGDIVAGAPAESAGHEKPVAYLVGGDISGVQAFIYTITARGATSALRGRSFYLQLLTEAVARFVLRRLGLPITNLIYQGGGGFYLLARAGDRKKLPDVQREISRILLAHHRGDLYLALTSVPMVTADFYDGRISHRWDDLARALKLVKQRRFTELEAKSLRDLFTPQGRGGGREKQCQVCGREHPRTHEEKQPGEQEGVRKCPLCVSYERLGDQLRRADYLWLEEQEIRVPEKPPEIEPGGWEDVLAAFGLQGGVTERPPQRSGNTHRLVLALKDNVLTAIRNEADTSVGRRFLVNVTPSYALEDNQWLAGQPEPTRDRLRGDLPPNPIDRIVKPFSVLEAQSSGIPRLGVLRMDVDDMGQLFSQGFVLGRGEETEHIATLSRVASLSFAVSLYFEGWVEVLAERIGRQELAGIQRLYSIYSGGDDLFFVGSWDAVVELACAIRADLTRFCADHPGIHASAGIALVGGKYPLYQAASDAGAAEAKAKDLKWRDEQESERSKDAVTADGRAGDRGRGPLDEQEGERSKDAVTFLGQTLPWRRFGLHAREKEGMETACALAYTLKAMVKPEGDQETVPQTLLRHLIRAHEMHEKAAEARRSRGEDVNKAGEKQVYWGPWMWRGYYFLKQMAHRYRRDERGPAIEALADRLHEDHFRAIEWIGIAARYADLLTR